MTIQILGSSGSWFGPNETQRALVGFTLGLVGSADKGDVEMWHGLRTARPVRSHPHQNQGLTHLSQFNAGEIKGDMEWFARNVDGFDTGLFTTRTRYSDGSYRYTRGLDVDSSGWSNARMRVTYQSQSHDHWDQIDKERMYYFMRTGQTSLGNPFFVSGKGMGGALLFGDRTYLDTGASFLVARQGPLAQQVGVPGADLATIAQASLADTINTDPRRRSRRVDPQDIEVRPAQSGNGIAAFGPGKTYGRLRLIPLDRDPTNPWVLAALFNSRFSGQADFFDGVTGLNGQLAEIGGRRTLINGNRDLDAIQYGQGRFPWRNADQFWESIAQMVLDESGVRIAG